MPPRDALEPRAPSAAVERSVVAPRTVDPAYPAPPDAPLLVRERDQRPPARPTPPIVDLRIPVLDGLRGLAILLVLLHHFGMKYAADGTFFDRAFFGVVESAWCGVDLFFVLSGFLITGILVDARGESGALVNFYARRTLRIFPLYYACLAVFYLLLPLVDHPAARDYIAASEPHQVWYWTYLTNCHLAARGTLYDHLIPNIFWSLSIEEQFYLAWPFVALFCAPRTVLRVAVALVVLALGSRVAMSGAGWPAVASFALPFARMDCLAVGACLALLARREGGLEARIGMARWGIGLCLALLFLLAWPAGHLDWGSPLVHTLGFSALALGFGGLLVLAVPRGGSPWVRRALDNAPLRSLGKYSYALYLVHGPVGTACKLVYDPERMPLVLGSAVPRLVPYMLLAGAVSFALAFASWHLFEKHVLKLKDRFR